MYTIYKITNTITQKIYIGVTNQPINRRWAQHKSYARTQPTCNTKIVNALRKHGNDCWFIQEIYITWDIEHAATMETHFINEYDSYSTGYNSKLGGFTEIHVPRKRWTEERKQKVSAKLKGKIMHPGKPGPLNHSYGKPGTMTGRKHTDSAKQNMSISHHKRRPISIEGVQYESITAASKKLNIKNSTLQNRIRLGLVKLD